MICFSAFTVFESCMFCMFVCSITEPIVSGNVIKFTQLIPSSEFTSDLNMLALICV